MQGLEAKNLKFFYATYLFVTTCGIQSLSIAGYSILNQSYVVYSMEYIEILTLQASYPVPKTYSSPPSPGFTTYDIRCTTYCCLCYNSAHPNFAFLYLKGSWDDPNFNSVKIERYWDHV
jgi:hypothetical protein